MIVVEGIVIDVGVDDDFGVGCVGGFKNVVVEFGWCFVRGVELDDVWLVYCDEFVDLWDGFFFYVFCGFGNEVRVFFLLVGIVIGCVVVLEVFDCVWMFLVLGV